MRNQSNSKGEKSKRRILKEAFKLFIVYNVESVTVPLLEDTIGLKRGAIFYHFTNKEEIFMKAIDFYLFSNETIFSLKYYKINTYTLQDYITNKDQQVMMISNWLKKENIEKSVFQIITHLLSQAEIHYPDFSQKISTCYQSEKEMLTELLISAQNKNEVRKSILPLQIAPIFIYGIYSLPDNYSIQPAHVLYEIIKE